MMRTQLEAMDPAHQALQELLPWFVNGTLTPDQLDMVAEHLRGCAQCRQDVEWQRSVAAAGPAAPEGMDMERAMGRLMARLEPREAAAPRARESGAWRAWMPWALAAQTALIAVLALQTMAPDGRQADYRVLGAGPAGASGNMVVAFRPDAALSDLQRLAQANGARVIDGPTVTGAYVLEVAAGRQAQVAAAFKADPAVLLAEPLAPGGGQ